MPAEGKQSGCVVGGEAEFMGTLKQCEKVT